MITSSGWRSGGRLAIALYDVGSIATSYGFPRRTTYDGDAGHARSAGVGLTSAQCHHTSHNIVRADSRPLPHDLPQRDEGALDMHCRLS
jgi:hypothetical protein